MRDPNSSTPSEVTTIVTKHGGPNPYGEPLWRIVLSSDRVSKKTGWWHEFADGNLELIVRDASGQFHYNPITAKSIEYGTRETQKWPVNGWIMERWFPPEVWGERETWDKEQGPYPERGDYCMLGGPYDKIPETSDICAAIDQWKHEFDHRPRDLQLAYHMMIEQERVAEEKAADDLEKELRALYFGEVAPIFKSTSLEAQRVRNEIQASIGETSHIGAGQ